MEKSYVYFIGSIDVRTETLNAVKIGKSDNPVCRLGNMGTDNKDALVLMNTIEYPNPQEALTRERQLHKQFEPSRLRGEWYSVTPELLQVVYNEKALLAYLSENAKVAENMYPDVTEVSVIYKNFLFSTFDVAIHGKIAVKDVTALWEKAVDTNDKVVTYFPSPQERNKWMREMFPNARYTRTRDTSGKLVVCWKGIEIKA